jgi:hypothetical protein
MDVPDTRTEETQLKEGFGVAGGRKVRKAKINKHKRKKRARSNRHKNK